MIEVITAIFVILLWLAVFVVSRFITTLIHEFGHAIPALLFTDSAVDVHIGSYGDETKSLKIDLGRLSIFFRFNIFHWNLGLCRHQGKDLTHQQALIITLGGPVMSLLMAIVLLFLIRSNEYSDGTITLISLFIGSTIWDFLVNTIPARTPIILSDGSAVYNDGRQFLNLLKESKQPPEYHAAQKLFQDQKFEEAAEKMQDLMDKGVKSRQVYQMTIQSLTQSGQTEEALTMYEKMKDQHGLLVEDTMHLGKIFFGKGDYEQAIAWFSQGIHIDFRNASLLNARGKAYIQLSEYKKAFRDFNAAINYQGDYPESYLFRAFTLIKLKQLDAAKWDLDHVREVSVNDSRLFLHLGFYHESKDEIKEALKNYQKAQDLGSDYHGLEYRMGMIEQELDRA